MVVRALFKLAWFVTKVAVRFVLIPLIISAVTASLLEGAADKLREAAKDDRNGSLVQPKAELKATPKARKSS